MSEHPLFGPVWEENLLGIVPFAPLCRMGGGECKVTPPLLMHQGSSPFGRALALLLTPAPSPTPLLCSSDGGRGRVTFLRVLFFGVPIKPRESVTASSDHSGSRGYNLLEHRRGKATAPHWPAGCWQHNRWWWGSDNL